MSKPKARVLSWRKEIEAELDLAQKAVPPLEAAHETAEAQAKVIAEGYRETQMLLGKRLDPFGHHGADIFGAIEPLEQPLMLRADAHAQEVEQAKNRRARALADLVAARTTVARLKRALAQIDRIVPPAESEAAA